MDSEWTSVVPAEHNAMAEVMMRCVHDAGVRADRVHRANDGVLGIFYVLPDRSECSTRGDSVASALLSRSMASTGQRSSPSPSLATGCMPRVSPHCAAPLRCSVESAFASGRSAFGADLHRSEPPTGIGHSG